MSCALKVLGKLLPPGPAFPCRACRSATPLSSFFANEKRYFCEARGQPMAGDLSASNARRESVIFVYCSIEASSFCGWVLLNHTQMSRDIQDTMMPLAALSIWPPRLFVTWGPGGKFYQTPVCPGGIVCGSGLAFLRSPHRQFCGSLCFDRRYLAGETKRANWYVSTGGGLLGMHNYYMVTPEGKLIINLFGGCWVHIYMIWPNSINREIQRARARRLIKVKLWYHETLDE